MRRNILLVALFLLFGTVLQAGRLRVVYRGNLPSVMVEINGHGRGRISRNSTRVFRVLRRNARIRLYSGEMESVKNVRIPRMRTTTVRFFRPVFRGVVLRLEGRYNWARVYINGRMRGRVYRDRPRLIRLPPGRVYRIQAVRRAIIRGEYRVVLARSGPRAARTITFDF